MIQRKPPKRSPSTRRDRRRARRRRQLAYFAAVGAVVIVVGGFFAAWGLDRAAHADTVPRNVSIAGYAVGGLGEEDLSRAVAQIATDYGQTPVLITTPEKTVETTAGEVGLRLDQAAVVDEALAAGNGIGTWVSGFFTDHTIELHFEPAQLGNAPALVSLAEEFAVEPTEPVVALESDQFVAVAGSPGSTLDADAALTRIIEAAAAGGNPIVVEVDPAEIPPVTPDASVEAFADELNAATAAGVRLSVADATYDASAAELRGWLTPSWDGGSGTYGIKADETQAAVEAAFPDVGTPGEPGTPTVVDREPVVEPGVDGTGCCSEDTPDRIVAAVRDGSPTVQLDLTNKPSAVGLDFLDERGIVELVSEFTTEYQPGQSRVTNIQRIADMSRGAIIGPGEQFSLNGHVGQRTTEKGFVPGGAIYNGEFVEDIGGGVSQFATTLFNAAYYAGLDFDTYQAHTIYISRYPYGREATVSWPAPDLAFTNTTDYSVMIWTSYTDASVTVEMYSTEHIDVVDSNLFEGSSGACTRVTAERTRTYPDGNVVVDTVGALYQPAEGIGCDGLPTNPTPEPEPPPPPEEPAEPPPEEPPAEPPPEEPPAEPPAEPPPPEEPPPAEQPEVAPTPDPPPDESAAAPDA